MKDGGTKRLLVVVAVLCVAALWHVGVASPALTGQPAVVILNPPTGVNPVGATHCVTATVLDAFGNPVNDVIVDFTVTPIGPNNSPQPLTNPSPATGEGGQLPGQATFCFTALQPGIDDVHAVAEGGVAAPTRLGDQIGGNPSADATKLFIPAANTSSCSALITNGGWFVDDYGTKVNFGGNAQTDSTSLASGQEEFQATFNLHSLFVHALTCGDLRTAATIYGEATIDGSGTHYFIISETDAGEPGTNDTYGILVDNGYYSGQHKLMGGNIQIH